MAGRKEAKTTKTKRTYTDNEKATALANIYGIRAKGVVDYFYIGSTKHSIEHRFKQHIEIVKRGLNNNRHFVYKMNQIGFENVEIELIEQVELSRQFQREYQIIRKLLASGVKLTNILTDDYVGMRAIESNIEKYQEPKYFARLLCVSMAEIGKPCHDPQYAKLVDKLETVALRFIRHTLNQGDALLHYLYPERWTNASKT